MPRMILSWRLTGAAVMTGILTKQYVFYKLFMKQTAIISFFYYCASVLVQLQGDNPLAFDECVIN